MIFAPAFAFAVLLATFYAAVVHFAIGGSFRLLSILLLTSWLAFALGHGIGQVMGITPFNIGAVNVFTGTLGAIIGLTTTSILMWRQRWN